MPAVVGTFMHAAELWEARGRRGGHLHACRGAVGSTRQVGFAPVNEDDGGRGARKHKGILHRCVAAAHDDDRFAAVQEAVAGGAGGDAPAL